MDKDIYSTIAEETRKLFNAFCYEGFTEAQATELVSSQYAFAVINAETERRRKLSRQEIMDRMRKVNEKRKQDV